MTASPPKARFSFRPWLFILGLSLGLWGGWTIFNRAIGTASIHNDERLVLQPVLARTTAEGSLELAVEVWVHEPETDDLLRRGLIEELEKNLELKTDDAALAILRQRLQPLLADNERGKKVRVRFAGQSTELPPTSADGCSLLNWKAARPKSGESSMLEALLPESHPQFGMVQVPVFTPADGGTLLISDIDDTVKISNVRDKKALMRATLLEPFRAVPGMADRYRQWMAGGRVHLHFVSASPKGLYEPLSQFLMESGFPPATCSLKSVRFKDTSLLSLFEDPQQYKENLIGELLERFSDQSAVLVGDNGEKDPEAYGVLAARFGGRIRQIYIRNVAGESPQDARYQAAFGSLPAGRWMLFDEPAELPALLPGHDSHDPPGAKNP